MSNHESHMSARAIRHSRFVIPSSLGLSSFVIFLLCVSAPPRDASAQQPMPVGQPGKWVLKPAFSDEFDGDSVDARKWQDEPPSWGPWTWTKDNAIVQDGKLQLRMTHEPHSRKNQPRLFYKSGIIRSKLQRTYGYYEARIKGCSLFPGACPAFWLYSDGKASSGEVRYCEIDIVELQMNELDRGTGRRNPVNHIDMNLHLRLADKDGTVRWVRPGIDPDLCASHWIAPWDPRDDFHVYGCDVTPEAIVWYVDGKEVARKPNRYWHLPMNVTLSLGLRHPHIGWSDQTMWPVPEAATSEGFPTQMEEDYVRVSERMEEK